jgi:hypothetical protein
MVSMTLTRSGFWMKSRRACTTQRRASFFIYAPSRASLKKTPCGFRCVATIPRYYTMLLCYTGCVRFIFASGDATQGTRAEGLPEAMFLQLMSSLPPSWAECLPEVMLRRLPPPLADRIDRRGWSRTTAHDRCFRGPRSTETKRQERDAGQHLRELVDNHTGRSLSHTSCPAPHSTLTREVCAGGCAGVQKTHLQPLQRQQRRLPGGQRCAALHRAAH